MGFEDVLKYLNLFVEFFRRYWFIKDFEKFVGRNFIRVFKMVEKVKKGFKGFIKKLMK